MTQTTPQKLRGYELEENLGQGGFGAVYRAYQVAIAREVAIKIILPQFANHPDFIRRFEAEAQLIARLEHPHIVPLYDFWRDPQGAYLVMRYVRGGSLRHSMTGTPMEATKALKILEQVAQALDMAHHHQVVHCDIKPDNILMDEAENAYLSDFGIARMMKSDLSGSFETGEAATLMGSLGYLSPEQARGATLNQRSDIYSLAVIAFELLAGKHPFHQFSPTTQLFKHLSEPLPYIVAFRNDLPSAVDEVIQRASAKSEAERFNTASEFILALRGALGGNALTIQPAPAATPMVEVSNPYKGLRPFEEADAEDFFGREALVRKLVERLETPTTLKPGTFQRESVPYRFLAVVGPSGSGKSSVVKAGLIPALRRGFLPGSSNWLITQMTPGEHPVQQLEDELLQVASRAVPDLGLRLQAGPHGLAEALPDLFNDPRSEVLLVIDQFEELFTAGIDEVERVLFLESLRQAVTNANSRLRVIITLRADFYDRPLRYAGFGELVQKRTEVVLPLSLNDLTQAIIGPVERSGITLERGLAMEIAAEVIDQPGALPLLQYALTELFERREGRNMTRAAYQALDGVMGALTRRAEELYALELDPPSQEAAKILFQRLVTLGEGTGDTRRRVFRTELDSLSPQVSQVIDMFGRARLLSFDRDSFTRSPTVEVAHEALIREWRTLREWLNENRESIRQQQHLTTTAQNWANGGRAPDDLYRGARLLQATEWAAAHTRELNPLEKEFLEAANALARSEAAEREAQHQRELAAAQKLAEAEKVRAEEQTQAAQKLRLRGRSLLVALILVIGLFAAAAWLGIQANRQRQSAEQNFIRSERLRLAAQASALLLSGSELDTAPLLSLVSLKMGYSPEADAALQRAMTYTYPAHIWSEQHGAINAVAFSPDSQLAATASDDNTVILYAVATGQKIHTLTGHTSAVSSLAFSPDGRTLASGSADATICLWDVESGDQLRALEGHVDTIWGLAFTPDGQNLVSGGTDALILVWDAATGQEIHKIEPPTSITSIAISPNGRTLLTSGDDGVARLYDLEHGVPVQALRGHAAAVVAVAFSHDGRFLATGSDDKTAYIWDAATGEVIQRLVGHQEGVYGLSFSPDDRYLLTAGYDRVAIMWEVTSGVIMRKFLGHTSSLYAGVISPDGQWVLTGSYDSTARLWPSGLQPDPRRFSHHSSVVALTLSRDGKTLLTGTSSGEAYLWETTTGALLHTLSGHVGAIESLALSPDSKLALTAGDDYTVRVWDTGSGKQLRLLEGFGQMLWVVRFAPDGQHALIAGDGGLALWDVQAGALTRTLVADEVVYGAAFSPDGKYILAGGYGGISLYQADTGDLAFHQPREGERSYFSISFSPNGKYALAAGSKTTLFEFPAMRPVRDFSGYNGSVLSSAFSPAGAQLATTAEDGAARLWNVSTGQQLRAISSQQALANTIAFSLDGTQIYVGGADNTVWRWDVDYHALVKYACTIIARDLTPREREKYGITDSAPVCAGQ